MERKVSPERTGWRDEKFSKRHRDYYGYDAPLVDVDHMVDAHTEAFIGMEYDRALPVALLEAKATGAQPTNLKHPSIRALAHLATNSKIPFFIVRYDASCWNFFVIPVNAFALKAVPVATVMTELEYVTHIIYGLRNRPVPREIEARLMTTLSDKSRTWKQRASNQPKAPQS